MSDEQVPVGETVLTSGGDQIFPKGLPVGTVTKVANGRDLFLNIKIKAAANLDKLEEVLVLVEKQERQATAEDNVRVRAADILAQRLPSVPDKPAADAAAAAANPAGADTGTSAGSAQPISTNPESKPKGPATAQQSKNSSATTATAHVPAGASSAGTAAGATSAAGPKAVSASPDHKIAVVPNNVPSSVSSKPATGLKSPVSQTKSAQAPSAGPSTKPAQGASTKPVPAASQTSAQPSNPQPPADENNPQ
jgi:rod shape-determining protein MreC